MEELEHTYIVDWYLPQIKKEQKEKEQEINEKIVEKVFIDYAKRD